MSFRESKRFLIVYGYTQSGTRSDTSGSSITVIGRGTVVSPLLWDGGRWCPLIVIGVEERQGHPPLVIELTVYLFSVYWLPPLVRFLRLPCPTILFLGVTFDEVPCTLSR